MAGIVDFRLPFADGHWNEWPRHFFNRQSSIANRQSPIPGAIIPLMIGDEREAVEAATTLREKGIFVPAIRYPAVARGKARLRVTLSAAHTAADVTELVTALNQIVNHKS